LLLDIGGRHGTGPSQVALRWLMQQEGVLPIAGAKNAGQARQNAEALTFSLDDDELDALDRATAPQSKRQR
jgi:aryl-alcohol dehydrogenase-like predicted oxidoreductase